MKALKAYLIGLGSRFLYGIQLLLGLPLTIALLLLSPIWWLFTGSQIPFPKWLDRIHDGADFTL